MREESAGKRCTKGDEQHGEGSRWRWGRREVERRGGGKKTVLEKSIQ